MKSPAHDVVNLIRLNNDFATLGDTLVSAYRRELGSNRIPAQSWARSKVQDWHVIRECLSDTAPGILRTGTALRDYHSKFSAIIDTTEPVRRHNCTALLPEHDGADALLGYCFNELVGGKTSETHSTPSNFKVLATASITFITFLVRAPCPC